jgi:hypothetical protein
MISAKPESLRRRKPLKAVIPGNILQGGAILQLFSIKY